MDDVKIYSVPMSSVEVKDLYESEKKRKVIEDNIQSGENFAFGSYEYLFDISTCGDDENEFLVLSSTGEKRCCAFEKSALELNSKNKWICIQNDGRINGKMILLRYDLKRLPDNKLEFEFNYPPELRTFDPKYFTLKDPDFKKIEDYIINEGRDFIVVEIMSLESRILYSLKYPYFIIDDFSDESEIDNSIFSFTLPCYPNLNKIIIKSSLGIALYEITLNNLC
ncbi:MAG: hypothetical protein QXJ28_03195 [Candidatus Pacearchaeota archaeon]